MSKELLQSDEEMYFFWFLEELFCAGYIKEYTLQPPAFKLSDSVEYGWNKSKPTKKEPTRIERMLSSFIKGSEYTADCKITWNLKAKYIFYIPGFPDNPKDNRFISEFDSGYDVSYIEVKPIRDFKNMTRLFITKQKWIYQLYSIYVNLVIPEKLFNNMFTPQRYLTQNINPKKLRKIKFKTRTLKEYEESIR